MSEVENGFCSLDNVNVQQIRSFIRILLARCCVLNGISGTIRHAMMLRYIIIHIIVCHAGESVRI